MLEPPANESTSDPTLLDRNEALRVEAAAALRDLVHAFVGHEHEDAELLALRDWARDQAAQVDRRSPRSRERLLRQAQSAAPPGEWQSLGRAGFEDRAVGGGANPTSLVFDVSRDGDTMVAYVTLDAAFEGAPGRAHGGIVAAAFDDFTGMIIGMLQEPAFTGELTVRYVRPVPVRTPLRLRTWLDSREGRKLQIQADAHNGDELVATCRATYITVDPTRFARFADPR